MNVLVTGANGFLGSWLTKRLLEEGHQVSALVRKNSDLTEFGKAKPHLVFGDVTDYSSLQQGFKNQEIIFHLAGVVAYSKAQRPLMEKVNVQGTAHVIKACEELQVPQLLHLSSVVTIGADTKPRPLNENSEYTIENLNLGYFETKRKAEQLVIAAAKENRIRAICVNPSTIYGFGDAKKGSRKTQIQVAQGRMRFYTSGGVNVVPVEDVIEGIILALKKGKNGERYILSSENMLIKDLFEKISFFAKVPAPKAKIPDLLLYGLGHLGDLLTKANVPVGLSAEKAHTATLFHWFECHKAISELDYKPTSADSAIEKSVRWMKDHKYIL